MSSSRSDIVVRHGRIISLAAILGAAACSAPSTEDASRGNARVIGGKEDSGDPAIVALYASAGSKGALCTCEIVSSRVCLTAAHCVDPQVLGFQPTEWTVFTGPDVRTNRGDALPVAEVHPHPLYDPTSDSHPDHDIGVAILKTPIGITPLPFYPKSIDDAFGARVRIAGYGMTVDGDSKTAGHKNTGYVTLAQTTPQQIVVLDAATVQCHGDSGGPTLLDVEGAEQIIGIASTTITSDGSCIAGLHSTRIDANIDFIMQYKNAFP